MVLLNVIAALLLALTPALEPCRLHDFFCHEDVALAVEHQHADHSHGSGAENHGSDKSQPCPEHPKNCNHLTDAAGVPAVISVVLAVPGLPAIDAGFVSSLVSGAPAIRHSFQHPPPTGVSLVGTTNLRI